MRQNIHLWLVSVLLGVLLPVTVWGDGFAADPGDRNHLPYAGSTGGHHHSGYLRLQRGMTENGYYVRIYLDGLRPGDIHVYLQRNHLVLEIDKGGQYERYKPDARRASQWQIQFRRQLRLPYDADVTRMTKRTKNGIMEIYMPIDPSRRW